MKTTLVAIIAIILYTEARVEKITVTQIGGVTFAQVEKGWWFE